MSGTSEPYILPPRGDSKRWSVASQASSLVREALALRFFKKGGHMGAHAFFDVRDEQSSDDDILDHTYWETEHLMENGFGDTSEWVRSRYQYTLVTWAGADQRMLVSLVQKETYKELGRVELVQDAGAKQLDSLVSQFRTLINEQA